MKKIRNSRLIAVVFLILFSAAAPPVALAHDSSRIVPVELKFAGMIKDDPLFQLSVTGSPEQNNFTIIIYDEEGNTLYEENIRKEIFSKKFLLKTEELGDETLRFEVTSRKARKVVVYEISSRSRMVQETTIKRTSEW